MLSGLGLKGLGALSQGFIFAKAAFVHFHERARAKRERMSELEPPLPEAAPEWTMGEGVVAKYWTGLKRYPNGFWADFKLNAAE